MGLVALLGDCHQTSLNRRKGRGVKSGAQGFSEMLQVVGPRLATSTRSSDTTLKTKNIRAYFSKNLMDFLVETLLPGASLHYVD